MGPDVDGEAQDPGAVKVEIGDDPEENAWLISKVTPAGVLGFVNFNSSAVSDVMIRFCSGPPIRFAYVLCSIFTAIVFSVSLIE